jgi:hypothetical protein
MNIFAKLAATAVFAMLALPGQATAQTQTMTQAQVDQITGQAMTSHEGSEYTSLNQGQAVGNGDTILVSSDSSVVLNVTDGTNTWQVTLGPGTHRVTPGLLQTSSGAPIASQTRGNVTFSVATILGTAALAAAGIASMDDVPPKHPVSH